MEDMLYEVESVRRFCGISLERVPDETRFSTSGAAWSVMDWGGSCLRGSTRIWQGRFAAEGR